MQSEMLIGASFERGGGVRDAIVNPRTGETILDLPEASEAQVNKAVAAAREAFATWSRTTPGERAGYLLKIADRIEADAEEFARLEALNCGKPFHAMLADRSEI